MGCALLHGWFRLRVGVSPISLVVVTAADRAAATLRRGGTEPLRPLRGHLPFQGRLCGKCAKWLPPRRELSADRLTEGLPRLRYNAVYHPNASIPQAALPRSQEAFGKVTTKSCPPGRGQRPAPAGFYFIVEIFAEIGYTIL